MKITKWTLIGQFAKKNGVLGALTLATGIFYNIFTILIPISLSKFYEFGFGFSSHRLKAFGFVPFIDSPNFTTFICVFFSLIVLRFIFEYANRYGIALIGENFSKSLRESLFAAQLQIAMPVYDDKGIGKYLLRFSGDLKSIQNYVKKGLFRFVQDSILLVIVIAVISYINPVLSLIIFGCISVASLLLWGINKKLYTRSLESRNQKAGLLSFVNTRLRAIVSLKTYNKYRPEEKRFNKRSDKVYDAGKSYVRVTSLLEAIIPAITYALLGVVMAYVYYIAQQNKGFIDGSSTLLIILLIISILPVLRRSLRVSIVWKLGEISFLKLIRILELPKENVLPVDGESLRESSITFEGVSFAYPNTENFVFENLNLFISEKSTVMIQGRPGSGKSTLIRLLLKLINPNEGERYLGVKSFNSLSEKTVRKQMAVVSKSYPLYGKNVYEAIVYSRKPMSKIKAEKLLEKLQQYEHPNDRISLDAKIGDLGSNLNTSQQKLLFYCRALLTDKQILLIEEPFKNLNVKTAELINSMLRKEHRKKTLIIIDNQLVDELEFDAIFSIPELMTPRASNFAVV